MCIGNPHETDFRLKYAQQLNGNSLQSQAVYPARKGNEQMANSRLLPVERPIAQSSLQCRDSIAVPS